MAEKKYKVVTLSVSGKGKNIYRNGDIVSPSQIQNFEEILKNEGEKAFIEIKEEVEEETKAKAPVENKQK